MFGNYVECEVEGGFYFCNLYNCGGVNDGGIDLVDCNGDGVIEEGEGY